jgi:hypothetical protein
MALARSHPAAQKGHGFLTVTDDVKPAGRCSFLKGFADQPHVCVIIVHQENLD